MCVHKKLRLCTLSGYVFWLFMMKTVLVTVGTTKFDKLIEEVGKTQVLDLLSSQGYSQIRFQVGTGSCKEKHHPKIELKYSKYFENFGEEIEKADLVISHAGAGTCLEVLKRHKPLVVVINEDLMDNHQSELAEQLEKDGFLRWCSPQNLKSVLLNGQVVFKPYPEPVKGVFSTYLDKCMGFS